MEIARRLAGGDTAALEIVMRRNNQTLYRAARSILRNDEDAEEAVQDTYLKAYRAISAYKGGSKLSKIGRASCRERGENWVEGAEWQRNKTQTNQTDADTKRVR